MAYYYLYDGTNTYNLDSNALKIDLGTPKRRYKVEDFVGSHGGILKGFGFYAHRVITISMKFHNITGNTTWTSTRDSFLAYINKSKWDNLWFYIKHDDGTTITRTRCYPSPSGTESYTYIKVSSDWSFQFICPDPFVTNVTPVTGSETVIDSTEHTFEVTNNGNIDCPIIVKFTPTGNETVFQVEIADSFGVRLERTNFLAGELITYDTSDGSMTIAGIEVDPSQYVTAGSIFNIPVGTSNIYVNCSGAGTFAYSYSERYL